MLYIRPDSLRDIAYSNTNFRWWYAGVDTTGYGAARFIMSPEFQALYPGDDIT